MTPPPCWEHFPSFSAFHMRMHLQYSILAFNIQYLVKPSTLVFWVYSPMFMYSTKVTGKLIEKKSEVLLNISYYFRSEKSVPFEAGWDPYMQLVAAYKEMKDLAKKKGKNLPVETEAHFLLFQLEIICRCKGDFPLVNGFWRFRQLNIGKSTPQPLCKYVYGKTEIVQYLNYWASDKHLKFIEMLIYLFSCLSW